MTAYPDLASIPVTVDGVVIATHPDASVDIVRQCSKHGVREFGSTAPSGRQRVARSGSRVRDRWPPPHCRRVSAHVLRSGRFRTQMYEVVASAAGACAEVNASLSLKEAPEPDFRLDSSGRHGQFRARRKNSFAQGLNHPAQSHHDCACTCRQERANANVTRTRTQTRPARRS